MLLWPECHWKICLWTSLGGTRNERGQTVPCSGHHRLHAVDNVAPKESAQSCLAVRNSVQPIIHHNSHDRRTILRTRSSRLPATRAIDCRHRTGRRCNLVSTGDEALGFFRREPSQPARLPARHCIRRIILRIPNISGAITTVSVYRLPLITLPLVLLSLAGVWLF